MPAEPSTSKQLLAAECKTERLFTPNVPIALPDLLAGRMDLLPKVRDSVRTPGQHVVVYGDRGVGKSSIARVSAAYIDQIDNPAVGGDRYVPVFVSCTSDESFEQIWANALGLLTVATKKPQMGLGPTPPIQQASPLEDLTINGPNDVLSVLRPLVGGSRFVFFVDEFDRLRNDDVPRMFSDTMKLFSDTGVPVTIVIVGVAETISDLIGEHESIRRNLAEVQVLPMNAVELAELVSVRFERAGMAYETSVDSRVGLLAQGFPHSAHWLGLWSARKALQRKSLSVTTGDVDDGVTAALASSFEHLSQMHDRAVESSYPGNLFSDVLLACAMVRKDSTGYFRAPDVGPLLTKIRGRPAPYAQAAYQSHIARFCEPDRGPVLLRTGRERRYRYKFVDPQLVPYLLLRGQNEGRADLLADLHS